LLERKILNLLFLQIKAGYVEGLQAGEESSLQEGFNEGFAKSVIVMMKASKLLGSMRYV
jgi:hypothetical protein